MRPSASPTSPSAQRSQKPSAPRTGDLGIVVETRKRDRVAEREVRRDAADRADLAFDVVEPDVALGRSIEFEDTERSEPIDERPPHFLRKPVADCDPQAVRLLRGSDRRGDEIAAEFADILKGRAFPACDIVPEAARRKALGDCDRTAEDQWRAERDNAADAVVHRQAIVEPIGRGQAGEAGKPVDPDDEPAMTDLGGLRQSGRSRSENPQRAIVERNRRRSVSASSARRSRSKLQHQFDGRPTGRLPWTQISIVSSSPVSSLLRKRPRIRPQR